MVSSIAHHSQSFLDTKRSNGHARGHRLVIDLTADIGDEVVKPPNVFSGA